MAQPASESASAITLPADDPADSEEVARSLKLARMLWEEGQIKEAVRALQRGAAAAEEVGNDMRALALARSAADLMALASPSGAPLSADGSGSTAAVSLSADGSGSTAAVSASAAAASSSPSAGPSAPRPVRSLVTTPRAPSIKPDGKGGEGPSIASTRGESPAPPSVAPKPEASTTSVRPDAPSANVLSSAPPAPDPNSAPISSPTPARVAASGRISAAPGIADKRVGSSASRSNGVSGAPFPVSGKELRVSVKRSALDENMFVVRPLGPGARLPPGAREAVLIFSDEE